MIRESININLSFYRIVSLIFFSLQLKLRSHFKMILLSYSSAFSCLVFLLVGCNARTLPLNALADNGEALISPSNNTSILSVSPHDNYTFLAINPRNEVELHNAISQVKPQTFSILFNPSHSAFVAALASNDTQTLVQVLNQVFSNALTPVRQNDSLSNFPTTPPTDPITLTNDELRQDFQGYRRNEQLTFVEDLQEFALQMATNLLARMGATGATHQTDLPVDVVEYALQTSTASGIWSFQRGLALKYGDVLGSIYLFGVWIKLWSREEQTQSPVIPGCDMILRKQTTFGDWPSVAVAVFRMFPPVPTSRSIKR